MNFLTATGIAVIVTALAADIVGDNKARDVEKYVEYPMSIELLKAGGTLGEYLCAPIPGVFGQIYLFNTNTPNSTIKEVFGGNPSVTLNFKDIYSGNNASLFIKLSEGVLRDSYSNNPYRCMLARPVKAFLI